MLIDDLEIGTTPGTTLVGRRNWHRHRRRHQYRKAHVSERVALVIAVRTLENTDGARCIVFGR